MSRHDLWLFALLLGFFAVYKTVELYYPSIPFFHNYFEDLIALPIILKASQLAIQIIVKKYRHFVISMLDIFVITSLFCIYYEAILPTFDSRFTPDILDVICYAIGALFFTQFMNKPLHAYSSART